MCPAFDQAMLVQNQSKFYANHKNIIPRLETGHKWIFIGRFFQIHWRMAIENFDQKNTHVMTNARRTTSTDTPDGFDDSNRKEVKRETVAHTSPTRSCFHYQLTSDRSAIFAAIPRFQPLSEEFGTINIIALINKILINNIARGSFGGHWQRNYGISS